MYQLILPVVASALIASQQATMVEGVKDVERGACINYVIDDIVRTYDVDATPYNIKEQLLQDIKSECEQEFP